MEIERRRRQIPLALRWISSLSVAFIILVMGIIYYLSPEEGPIRYLSIAGFVGVIPFQILINYYKSKAEPEEPMVVPHPPPD
jgi:hypothetical protein